MKIAHLQDRAVLRLSGRDVADFLQGMITSDITQLAEGRPLWAGLLSPQGKTLFAFFCHADGADVLIDCDAGVAEALAKRLAMFRLRKDVAITREERLSVFAAWGADAGQGPADPRFAEAGARWIAETAAGADAPLQAYHAHRIPLGLPDQTEVADLLWLETNARELNGVSFTKGCYVGQENTARMHHRDKVRRRLLPLRLSGPAADDRVMAGERAAGLLRGTGAGDVRLAHLKLELAGEALTVAGHPARLLAPPWWDAGEAAAA
ncbi:MAG: folate-binding protein [Sphingomonadaceae bacterium]